MTTTLGLTISATCAVVMPLEETVVPAAEPLEESELRSTCWMTTLLPALPNRAPTKPPAKPMAAASTSATALRATLAPFFLRGFLAGFAFSARGAGSAGGGVAPPLPPAEAGSGSAAGEGSP